MKEILPKVTRVINFYDPGNRVAMDAVKMGQILVPAVHKFL